MAEPNDTKPAPAVARRLFATDAARQAALHVVGSKAFSIGDAYHVILRTSWWLLATIIVGGFFVINALFGAGYWLMGGVTNATTYLDHFFFSVHTFGTVGYGSMYPHSNAAEVLMSFETVTSLTLNAVLTGLVFAKFARPTARVMWSQHAVINDRDGVPTLMIRVANERRNHVVEAVMRVSILRAETTAEGERVRRIHDLPLVRSSSPSFILTWTAMHQIVPGSPLYGCTQEQLKAANAELVVTLTGLDETLGQTIYSRTSFVPDDLVYGARFRDLISPMPDGRAKVDYGVFHETTPAQLTWSKLGLADQPAN